VALARALARDFSVLLLDEPMAAVDRPSWPGLWSLVDQRLTEQGAVAILVTHDLHEAQAFGDQLAVIDRGRIIRIGDPHEVVSDPRTRRTAEVVGYSAWLEVISSTDGPLQFALHPDRIRLGGQSEAGYVLGANVTAVRAAGSGYRADIVVPSGTQFAAVGRGSCTTMSDVEIAVDCDEPLTVGSEVSVTALYPPLVASETAEGEVEARV
jgi:ABC-type sulfate/molybdate transport systems ATPase subunit